MKVLVYDDSLDYGGHQIMACLGIEGLMQDPELDVAALTDPRNTQLSDRLNDIPRLKTLHVPTPPARPRIFGTGRNNRHIRELRRLFRDQNPDVVLCIQGDLEHSARAVRAAEGAGIKCISYLALPHSKQEMGAKLGALRDLGIRSLLNLPDAYIVISNSMKQRLADRGVSKPITVVPNGVHTPTPITRPSNLKNPVIGLMGRIEFKQKRQNFMVDTFCNYPEAFESFRMIIMGDGPDAARLSKQISTCRRSDAITLEPWSTKIDAFYEQIDMLIIPSRYEGVPLVMLEALARGRPVLGSACDGMKDLLPEAWLFDPYDAESLVQAVARLQQSDGQDIHRLAEMIRSEMTVEIFRNLFQQAVIRA